MLAIIYLLYFGRLSHYIMSLSILSGIYDQYDLERYNIQAKAIVLQLL